MYTRLDVLRVSKATISQLRYWTKTGLVRSRATGREHNYETIEVLLAWMMVNTKGLSTHQMRDYVPAWRKGLAQIEPDQLKRSTILVDGYVLVVGEALRVLGGTFDASFNVREVLGAA